MTPKTRMSMNIAGKRMNDSFLTREEALAGWLRFWDKEEVKFFIRDQFGNYVRDEEGNLIAVRNGTKREMPDLFKLKYGRSKKTINP